MAIWNGTLPAFAALEKSIASKLSTLADALHGLTDSETAWSPIVYYNTTAWTLGNAVVDATYRRSGKLVFISLGIRMGSTTTFPGSGGFFIGNLPATPRRLSSSFPCGQGFAIDTSAGIVYPVLAWIGADAKIHLAVTTGTVPDMTNTAPYVWAVNDEVRLQLCFEAS